MNNEVSSSAPSYVILSPRRKALGLLCKKCQTECSYELTSKEVSILQNTDSLTESYLSNDISEEVYVAYSKEICKHCYMAERDKRYKELVCMVGQRFKPMVDEYLFGVGDIEALNIWIGTGLARKVFEYKQEYCL